MRNDLEKKMSDLEQKKSDLDRQKSDFEKVAIRKQSMHVMRPSIPLLCIENKTVKKNPSLQTRDIWMIFWTWEQI